MSDSVPSPQQADASTSSQTLVETADEQIMFSSTTLCIFRFVGRSINKSITRSLHASPLEGIRILDMTRIVAGPHCTMVLGDLGAEVIKIEKPGSGDEARLYGPPFINDTKDSAYFVALNRNKKSICINTQSKEGREIIYSLAKMSDVLVENFVPGKLDKLQLGYSDLKKIAPQLIYCSITGFGPEGPYRTRPGYDLIASSIGGLVHITGPQDGEPCKVGVAMVDLATGLYAHGAILAALIKRSKTGKGQKIDCNLLSTQLATLINIGSNYLNAGEEAVRWGTAHPSIVPYQAFPTKDGYYTIGAGSDKQFLEFCNLIDHANLASNEKFLSNKERVQNRQELIEVLTKIIVKKTNEEWQAIFANSSFPNGPVNNLEAAFDDPHVKHIDIVKTLDYAEGKIKLVGPAVTYSQGGNEIRSPPPTLGQHTNEVLSNDHAVPRVTVKLKKPKTDRKVQWSTETVDNENMGKKKSKCCCIFNKPLKFGESSSDSSDDECEHCQGHVDKKKKSDSLEASEDNCSRTESVIEEPPSSSGEPTHTTSE
ncbi:unnamed protein product [Ceutorhynchus assimilis]|uniref:L-carnitine dehydratase/alpha-methylacyl-coa racemase n=1 Tax=Ceutorhynchus assimilis TaxID=467358 RepID=A0A9N9QJC8_9CUCU|nr:unnamed protein product [Ceutorhynchus assimilis]